MTARPPDLRVDEPRATTRHATTRRAVALYAGLALLFFAPAFLPGRQIGGTDYFAGGFDFLEFATRRMAAGSLPKWVPYIFGGLPMYANPGGLFYPVRLLMSALLPIERVMAALYVVQFATAGLGMHGLVRALGVRPRLALVAGVAFELTGVTISYVFAGHDGRIIAATLAPLVFWFVLRAVEGGELRWFLYLALVLGLALLSAQLQSVYYLLIAGGLWAAFLLVRDRGVLRGPAIAQRVALGLSAVAFAFALAAVNLLPFASYVKDSPRATSAKRDFAFSTQFSMPPVETIGLAVPEQAGILGRYTGANQFKLHTEYVGALVLLMLVVGIAVARRDGVWRFMAALAAFMLSICYGSYTPLYQLYYRLLPGTSKFRSPSIALFLVSMSLVVMAALSLERLIHIVERRTAGEDDERTARRLVRFLTVGTALSLVAAIVAAGAAMNGSARAIGWARFAFFLWVTALALRAFARGGITLRTASIILVVATSADLLLVARNFIYTEPPAERVFAEDDVVRFLRAHTPGRVWVFPFPDQPGAVHYAGNGRFGPRSDYLMRFGIAQAGGEHGNQLYRWNQLVGIAPGGNVLDWHNFVQYPAIMEAAAVRYILSGVRLELYDATTKSGIPGIREVFRGSAFVYVDNRALPRAQLVPGVRAVSPGGALPLMQRDDWDPRLVALVEAPAAPFVAAAATPDAVPGLAQIDVDEPDRVQISVRATAPAMLVLADNDADGWVATIDGASTPILRTNHTFRGVPVTAGNHVVNFEFRPRLLYTGLYLSLASALLLCAGLFVTARRRGAPVAAPLRQGPSTGA